MKDYNDEKVVKAVRLMLEGMGIDWKNDENFQETPERVCRAFREFNNGLYENTNHMKTFKSSYDGILLLKSVDAVGVCPHHLLPISYNVSFAYIPAGKVLGLSKVPRIIKQLCARPMLQEDLTKDIADNFQKKLKPTGVAVIVRGVHGCMKYRGVKEAEHVVTSELRGAFYRKSNTRAEFYSLLNS